MVSRVHVLPPHSIVTIITGETVAVTGVREILFLWKSQRARQHLCIMCCKMQYKQINFLSGAITQKTYLVQT